MKQLQLAGRPVATRALPRRGCARGDHCTATAATTRRGGWFMAGMAAPGNRRRHRLPPRAGVRGQGTPCAHIPNRRGAERRAVSRSGLMSIHPTRGACGRLLIGIARKQVCMRARAFSQMQIATVCSTAKPTPYLQMTMTSRPRCACNMRAYPDRPRPRPCPRNRPDPSTSTPDRGRPTRGEGRG